MDAINDKDVEIIAVMSAAQVGKTDIMNNVVGYFTEQDPSPILVLMPTIEMAESWSKDRLAPMLRDSPCFKGLVKDPRSRDSGNTLLHKKFPGGHITMVGANAPSGLAGRPIRVVLCDEVDRYPVSAGTEGDPISLAMKRTTTFWNRKIMVVSTPTIKGASRIEMAYEQSDQRRYFIPCPHCDEFQTLKWPQVKWPEGKPEDAYYECERNGCVITDSDKSEMMIKGEWRATAPFSGTAGFHLNELYSPWVAFRRTVQQFLQAKKSPETLKTWINTSLGETFEDQGERVEESSLIARKEHWKEIPAEVLVLTAGIDVQDDRLEMEIVGWGYGEENWSIDYKILYGSPAEPQVWQDLEKQLGRTFAREDGTELIIACSAIDTGGHHTQAVYEFCTRHSMRRVMAIKGTSQTGRPIMGRPTTSNRMKVPLWPVGTDTAKEWIMSRLQIHEPGAGYCHFPATREEEWFKQLVSERRVTRYYKGVARMEWVKNRTRNEGLDCRVYALAALKILNPDLQEPPIKPQAKPAQENKNEDPRRAGGWIPKHNDWLKKR